MTNQNRQSFKNQPNKFLPQKRHFNAKIALLKNTIQRYHDFKRALHFYVKIKTIDLSLLKNFVWSVI